MRALAILCLITAAIAAAPSARAQTPVLRVAAMESGTVSWELETIRHEGFDTANGLTLEVLPVAPGPAGKIAFQGGAADAMVSDWIWVARQRAAGHDSVFVPYSRAVGGLMVAADSPAETLADLAGARIGVAGGELDKSWLLLQAYARQKYDLDLASETEQVFGAPPLIFKTALHGDLDGAVNYWHFLARMEAAGMRRLIDVADAAAVLGLDPDTPLLGYVFHGETLRENPDLVHGFAAASRAAKELLASEPAAWERLRPIIRAETEAQFEALRAGFIAGIPSATGVDEAAAGRMLQIMAELGGEDLVGEAHTLPQGLFVQPGI